MAPRSSPECPTAASCTKLNDDESANEAIPSKFQVWKLASRPHTLTASIVPVIVGHALTLQLIHRHPDWQFDQHPSADTPTSSCPASFDNSPDPRQAALLPLSLQFALFASLVQISTNLHNDYADFVRGADTAARVGHARATQKGWLTPSETMRGCCLALFAAGFVGAWCLVPAGCSAGWDPIGAAVVASSLFNAVAYTGGPFPLGCIGLGGVSIGYSGLGDLFVFFYFGLVATLGVPYLFLTRVACVSTTERLLRLLHPSLLRALPVGFLAVAIIVVNNLRDRHTDVHAGKKTMAVRFGKRFCQVEYFVLLVGSYAFCMWFWWSSSQMSDGWTELLPLLSLPMAIPQLKAVAFGEKDGSDLNAHVGGTAKVQMFYCILMAIGLRISITSSCNHQPMI